MASRARQPVNISIKKNRNRIQVSKKMEAQTHTQEQKKNHQASNFVRYCRRLVFLAVDLFLQFPVINNNYSMSARWI